jgi:hypothetical protein
MDFNTKKNDKKGNYTLRKRQKMDLNAKKRQKRYLDT